MLDRAAAADAEMRTKRLDALGARRLDAQQMPAVRMAGHALGLDRLARQRIGHEHRPVRRFGDAVAAVGQAVDEQPFGHRAGYGALQARGGDVRKIAALGQRVETPDQQQRIERKPDRQPDPDAGRAITAAESRAHSRRRSRSPRSRSRR